MGLFKKGNDEAQPEMVNEIPVKADVGAVVRRPGEGETTMYRDGIPVQVPADKVGHFQSLGFLLHASADLPALKAEVKLLIDQIGPALDAFVDAVLVDGVIDPADEGLLHVLTKTWNLSNQRLQEALNVVYQVYPIKPHARRAQ